MIVIHKPELGLFWASYPYQPLFQWGRSKVAVIYPLVWGLTSNNTTAMPLVHIPQRHELSPQRRPQCVLRTELTLSGRHRFHADILPEWTNMAM